MTLRPLRDTDLSRLITIEEAAQAVPWTRAAFERCLEVKYPGWVIEKEKEVLGFILYSVHSEECHILNLCVHPKHQRQGVGMSLLQHTLDLVKKQGALMSYLEVRRSNTRAIKLYKKVGFLHIGDRKNYYPVPTGYEDALIFSKDLTVE